MLEIRSLGYYKIQQSVLQQRLSKYCSLKSLPNIFEQYNNFKNKLQEVKAESKDLHPW